MRILFVSTIDRLLTSGIKIILSDAPAEKFKEFAKSVEENVLMLRLSKKHMVGRDLGNL
ncbi:MAG: hypothetical protein BWX92_03904 [Deltaproteobacteria bacterium ADurb.Bin135]|jgi:hypothetical protein|nr:MAG: hypothetical protein BWX92_03904 [Deltaproteobacteria bacterium ADurb.Bin135]